MQSVPITIGTSGQKNHHVTTNEKIIQMKYFILLFSILATIAISCKSKSTDTSNQPATAKDYYEKILDLEESMSEPLLKTEAEIKARSDKNNFAGLAQSAKAMEDTIDIRINIIKKMDAAGKGGEDFKTMAVRYFEYIKSIYTAYRNIGEAKNEEDRKAAADKMTTIINAQQGVIANLNNAQNKFAADNAFVLDPQ